MAKKKSTTKTTKNGKERWEGFGFSRNQERCGGIEEERLEAKREKFFEEQL